MRRKGLPFRDAYKITGELVALCIDPLGLTLETLPLDEYRKVCGAFDEGVYTAINLGKVRERPQGQGRAVSGKTSARRQRKSGRC